MSYEMTTNVLCEVREERLRQDVRWGEQNHPDIYGTHGLASSTRARYAANASSWKRVNDARAAGGRTAWDGVLLEEVFEALEQAGANAEKLREELVQVAAVATCWIEDIDRRGSHVG